LVEEARAQGLRLLACLDPPDGTAAHGPLLRRAYDLLEEGLDGLRLREAARWPEPLLVRLRHLLDAFPGAALVGVADGHEASDGPEPASGSATAAAHCHLLVGAPPGVPADAPGPLSPWALPPGTPYPEACLLLALPGCHEVPFAVLDAATPRTTALRTLLAARATQLALHGEDFTFLPTGDPRLTAVRRSHAGQTVLCLTSTADTPVLARIPVPDPTPAAAFVEIAHDIPAPHPAADEPETVRAAEGVLTLPLGPGRTRWFRLRPAQHSRSAEATDPFDPPTP
ncbi:hypothetical protein ACNFR6_20415, partial [Streptomyces sp. ECR3]